MGRPPKPRYKYRVRCWWGQTEVEARNIIEAKRLARRADRQIEWGYKHGAPMRIEKVEEKDDSTAAS